jgi:hypothetical protein
MIKDTRTGMAIRGEAGEEDNLRVYRRVGVPVQAAWRQGYSQGGMVSFVQTGDTAVEWRKTRNTVQAGRLKRT